MVFAIGPSDEMYNRFLTSLIKIDPQKPQKKDIENMEGNLCSLALSIISLIYLIIPLHQLIVPRCGKKEWMKVGQSQRPPFFDVHNRDKG